MKPIGGDVDDESMCVCFSYPYCTKFTSRSRVLIYLLAHLQILLEDTMLERKLPFRWIADHCAPVRALPHLRQDQIIHTFKIPFAHNLLQIPCQHFWPMKNQSIHDILSIHVGRVFTSRSNSDHANLILQVPPFLTRLGNGQDLFGQKVHGHPRSRHERQFDRFARRRSLGWRHRQGCRNKHLASPLPSPFAQAF